MRDQITSIGYKGLSKTASLVSKSGSLGVSNSGSCDLSPPIPSGPTFERTNSRTCESVKYVPPSTVQIIPPATNALASCEPLFHNRPAYEDTSLSRTYAANVRVCLDDRLFNGGTDYHKLMLLCMMADILAERAAKVPHEALGADVMGRLSDCAVSMSPTSSTVDALHFVGVEEMFPHLMACLRGSAAPSPTALKGVTASAAYYLDYISGLNQLMMMATQLHNDALDPRNHKYSAHQIALLYQALNMLRGNTKHLRKKIEDRFDEVKSITETASAPYLGAELQHWLQQITWDCRCMVLSCPESMHERVRCVTDVLYR